MPIAASAKVHLRTANFRSIRIINPESCPILKETCAIGKAKLMRWGDFPQPWMSRAVEAIAYLRDRQIEPVGQPKIPGLLRHDSQTQFDALVANIRAWSRNQPSHIALSLAAEAANEFV